MDNTKELHKTGGILPFDPIVLLQDVAKRWLLILLAALIVGIGSYIWTDMNYKPTYRTTATFVVTAKGSSSTVFSNLSSTTTLANTFSDLLNSSILRKSILEELGTSSFDGTIKASAVPDTNLLTMTITASDPRSSFLVAQAIIDHHEAVTYQVVDTISLEVLQRPTVPTAPSNYSNASGRMRSMTVYTAMAVSALLAMASFFRKSVRSGTEADEKLDCNYLGEIPHERKRRSLMNRLLRRKTSILITDPATSFRYVETIRKLRRRTERLMHGRKVLMITSLMENEGKSTVAVNLALALARKHSKVLLIDCDFRKPACHSILEHKELSCGLRDVLEGKATLADAVFCEKKSNLYLLLESKGSQNSGDLVSSRQMRELLMQVRQEYDYVILDLPPMAEVSDAESVMELADASLLVVRQNVAAVPAINKAIASLDSGKAKLLGCVLNNVYSTRIFSGEGTGYGYGYGHGYKYGRYSHYGHYDSFKNTK